MLSEWGLYSLNLELGILNVLNDWNNLPGEAIEHNEAG